VIPRPPAQVPNVPPDGSIAPDGYAPIPEWLGRRLHKRIRRLLACKPRAVADELVLIVRAATRTPDFGKYVGRNCMAVIINPPGAEYGFESTYYPDHRSPQSHAPPIIFPGVAYKGIESWEGPEPPSWWK
jgi:hypothetical protein